MSKEKIEVTSNKPSREAVSNFAKELVLLYNQKKKRGGKK